MLFKTAQEFFDYAKTIQRVSRSEELELAKRMREGDETAKKALIDSYIPVLAAYIQKNTREPSLEVIYRGFNLLSDSIHNFNFQIENPTFTRYLGEKIRLMMTHFIADSPVG